MFQTLAVGVDECTFIKSINGNLVTTCEEILDTSGTASIDS